MNVSKKAIDKWFFDNLNDFEYYACADLDDEVTVKAMTSLDFDILINRANNYYQQGVGALYMALDLKMLDYDEFSSYHEQYEVVRDGSISHIKQVRARFGKQSLDF